MIFPDWLYGHKTVTTIAILVFPYYLSHHSVFTLFTTTLQINRPNRTCFRLTEAPLYGDCMSPDVKYNYSLHLIWINRYNIKVCKPRWLNVSRTPASKLSWIYLRLVRSFNCCCWLLPPPPTLFALVGGLLAFPSVWTDEWLSFNCPPMAFTPQLFLRTVPPCEQESQTVFDRLTFLFLRFLVRIKKSTCKYDKFRFVSTKIFRGALVQPPYLHRRTFGGSRQQRYARYNELRLVLLISVLTNAAMAR